MQNPTWYESKALNKMSQNNFEYPHDLQIGKTVLDQLLSKGWVKTCDDVTKKTKICLTEEGAKARKLPALPHPFAKTMKKPAGLKMLEPRLKVLDLRVIKPKD